MVVARANCRRSGSAAIPAGVFPYNRYGRELFFVLATKE